MKFGERIKELRLEMGMSQPKLAKELGVSKGTVAMWESQDRCPVYSMVIRIAEFFDVTTDYLLGRSNIRHGRIIEAPAELADAGVTKVEKVGSEELTSSEVEAIRKMLAAVKGQD